MLYEFAEVDPATGDIYRVDGRADPTRVIQRHYMAAQAPEVGDDVTHDDGRVYRRIFSTPRRGIVRPGGRILHGLPKYLPGCEHVPEGRDHAGAVVVRNQDEARDAARIANEVTGADTRRDLNTFTLDADVVPQR